MNNLTIWCYKCGSMWFNRHQVDLYTGPLQRCPAIVTSGTYTTRCGGFTDGVRA